MRKNDYIDTKQQTTKKKKRKYPMDQWWHERINLKISWSKWQWKHSHKKIYGMQQKKFLEEVHRNTGLQETRKISNKQLIQYNPPPKTVRKRKTKKS